MDAADKDRVAAGWFRHAWDDYVDGLPVLIPVLLLQTLIYAPALWLVYRYHSFLPSIPYLLLVVTPVATGANLVYIKLARGSGARVADLFGAFPVYGRALGVSLWLGFLTIAGTMLLIVPGIILYLTYCFSEYAVVDKRTGVKESFALSAAMTEGWKGRLFLILSLTLLVNLMVPEVVMTEGTLSAPSLKFNLGAWNVVSDALKTLVFLPWLRIVMARAYDSLLAPRPPVEDVPEADDQP